MRVTVTLGAEAESTKFGVVTPLMVIARARDVDTAKFVSPGYCAVIECAPAVSEDVEKLAADAEFSVAVPSEVVPSRKVIIPVGDFCALVGVTLTMNVTLAPCAADDGPVSVVTVGISAGALMVIVSALDVLVAKFASPPYFAVIVCAPAERAVVESVATPAALSVPVPNEVAPSRKVTVPVGFAVPLAGVTLAE